MAEGVLVAGGDDGEFGVGGGLDGGFDLEAFVIYGDWAGLDSAIFEGALGSGITWVLDPCVVAFTEEAAGCEFDALLATRQDENLIGVAVHTPVGVEVARDGLSEGPVALIVTEVGESVGIVAEVFCVQLNPDFFGELVEGGDPGGEDGELF